VIVEASQLFSNLRGGEPFATVRPHGLSLPDSTHFAATSGVDLLHFGGADEVERRMAPDRVAEAVDVTADGVRDHSSCFGRRCARSAQFRCLEERLGHRVVMAVAFPGHRGSSGNLDTNAK